MQTNVELLHKKRTKFLVVIKKLYLFLSLSIYTSFLFYLEISSLLDFLNKTIGLFLFLIIHSIVVTMVFCYPYLFPKEQRATVKYFAHLIGWFCLFFQIMGLAGAMIAVFVGKKVLKAQGMADEISGIFSMEEEKFYNLLKGSDELLKNEVSTQPVLDILSGDNDDLKRSAINFLGRVRSQSSIRLLKKCLTDSSHEVRFYAHSTLVKIEESYLKRIKQVETKIKSEPTNSELHKNLGTIFIDYANSGMLEKDTTDYYLNLAIESYETAFKKNQNDYDCIITLGDLYLQAKKIGHAETYFKKAVSMSPDSAIPLIGLLQVYYEKNERNQIASIIEQLKTKEKPSDNLDKQIIFQFWSER